MTGVQSTGSSAMGTAIPRARHVAATGSCASITKLAARMITAAIIHRIAAVHRAAVRSGSAATGCAAPNESPVVGGKRAARPPGIVATAHAAHLFRHAVAAPHVARQALIAVEMSAYRRDLRPALAVYQ